MHIKLIEEHITFLVHTALKKFFILCDSLHTKPVT